MTQFAEWTPKKRVLPRSRSTQIFMCGSNNPRPTYGTNAIRSFLKMHHATDGSNKKSPSINSHHPFHFCTAALRGGVETVSCSIGSTHIRNTAKRKIPADSNGTSPTKASAVPRPEPGSYPYMRRQLQPSPRAFASALTPVVRSPPARQALETFRREPSMQHSVAPPHFVCSPPGTCPRY